MDDAAYHAAFASALISTGAISLVPNLILLLFPNYACASSGNAVMDAKMILSLGQALAAGGLLGDVFLHTLPHSMMNIGPHDHDSANRIGLGVLGGFLIFLVFDMLVRTYGFDHHRCQLSSVRCSTSTPVSKNRDGSEDKVGEIIEKEGFQYLFSSVVLLNLVADSLHNFTDGLAIGASFAASAPSIYDSGTSFWGNVGTMLQSRGGMATLSVLFHEIPHELGDFAVLVNAGMSKKQAIATQFSTSIAAFFGTCIGLMTMGKVGGIAGYDIMVPFTAGGFVYLAAVNILPELLNNENTKTQARFLQLVSFVLGIMFMYGVVLLENGHSHEHGHHLEHVNNDNHNLYHSKHENEGEHQHHHHDL